MRQISINILKSKKNHKLKIKNNRHIDQLRLLSQIEDHPIKVYIIFSDLF